MTNLRDIITSPIDEAKEAITRDYFTGTPSDAALLSFNEQFVIEHHGNWARISHKLHCLSITVSVSVSFERTIR